MKPENFKKLPEEKRGTVLNAALSCFGKNGYRKTSMSDIAAEAAISKAALFHYFGTKKELYLYLFKFCREEILANFICGTEDFFESIEIGMQMKIDTMKKHSGMFDFLFSIATETDSEVISEIRKDNAAGADKGVALLFEKVDWGRFQPSVSVKEVRNLVSWVSDGYIKAHTDCKDGELMAAEIKRYLDIIKKAVYKGEYL